MMNNKATYSVPVFILWFILLGPFSPVANGAPVISGLHPQKATPGETVSVFGSELVSNMELRFSSSSMQIFPIPADVNPDGTEARFQIPDNIPAGEYEIAILAQGGTYFSNSDFGFSLTVVAGGKPFGTVIRLDTPSEGLPTFGALIETIFTWSLQILGIVVFVMILFAGFKWFTAAGNTAKVKEAKDQITNAITGAIILLAAYIILYTINPDLVGGTFRLPGIGTQENSVEQEPLEAIRFDCNEQNQCVRNPNGRFTSPVCNNFCP